MLKEKVSSVDKILPILPLFALAVGYLVGNEDINRMLFPDLNDLTQATGQLLLSEEYWGNLSRTIGKALLAIVFGAYIGVPIGALMGEFRIVRRILESSLDFLRGIPITALCSYFYMLFGFTGASVIAPIYFSILGQVHATGSAISLVDQEIQDAAALDGASKLQMLTEIKLPMALPVMMTHLKNIVQYTLIAVVAMEMFGGNSRGLGGAAVAAQMSYRMGEAFVYLISLGLSSYLMGSVVNRLKEKTERALLGK